MSSVDNFLNLQQDKMEIQTIIDKLYYQTKIQDIQLHSMGDKINSICNNNVNISSEMKYYLSTIAHKMSNNRQRIGYDDRLIIKLALQYCLENMVNDDYV